MSDSSDYQPSDSARILGRISPSALVAQPESASILPGKPAEGFQIPPVNVTVGASVVQRDGANAPVRIDTVTHAEPTPQGGPRPVPFAPAEV